VIPSYFGREGASLFGAYHPPVTASARALGVVLCYPGPQEYRQAHWAYHKLATLLSTRGMHAFRFDYSCTGDSAGDSAAGSLAAWEGDIATAVAELRDVASVRRIAVVGMRLGAALAMRACTRATRVADLVLWDPVVRGDAYHAQLATVQAAGLRAAHYPEDDQRGPEELLGFPFPRAMREAVDALDLSSTPPPAVERALVIGADDRPDYRALATQLEGAGINASFVHHPDATLARGDWFHDTLLCHEIPNAIANHLARREG
jgi:pimeloyl-ACP methyl ester carboxylesterase